MRRRSCSRRARSRCRSPESSFSDRVVDTWGAWSFEKLPKALVVAGAGSSGAEIASAYARLGVEVTLVEMLDQVLPREDKDMARVVERQFKSDGIDVRTGAKVEGVEEQRSGVKVTVAGEEIKADYLVIAGGRTPDVEGLGLDAAGVEARRGRPHRDRRVPADLGEGRLRDRGPGARARARPQGLRGGGGRRRARGRRRHAPGRHQPDRRRDLLPPAGGERRHDRGAGDGRPARRSRSASSSSAAQAPRWSTTTARDW